MTELQALVAANAIPLLVGNRLRLQINNANLGEMTIGLRVRQLNASGEPIESYDEYGPIPPGTPVDQTIFLTAGMLLSVTVESVGDNVTYATCFASLQLIYGDVTQPASILYLGGGYFSNNQPYSFPYTQFQPVSYDCISGSVIDGTNPGAGNNYSEIMPTAVPFHLLGGSFYFTADANVAVRRLIVTFVNGNTEYSAFRSRTNIVADDQRRFILWLGNNIPDDNTDYHYISVNGPINQSPVTANIQVENRQAGDIINQIHFSTKRLNLSY